MHRRTLLKLALPPLTTMSTGCTMPSGSSRRTPPEHFMSFFEAMPADEPLVVDGLTEAEPRNETWARLFTQQPRSRVFTDRIDEASPYMRSQLQSDRYDDRFLVLVQMRVSTPQILSPVSPRQIEWIESSRLRVLLESRAIEDPSEELQNARSTVATSLSIFKYETRTPASVILPVQGTEGATRAEIVAQ